MEKTSGKYRRSKMIKNLSWSEREHKDYFSNPCIHFLKHSLSLSRKEKKKMCVCVGREGSTCMPGTAGCSVSSEIGEGSGAVLDDEEKDRNIDAKIWPLFPRSLQLSIHIRNE